MVAAAVFTSLRGSEIFMMELSALRKHINLGHKGSLPADPIKLGTDLSLVPHVFRALLGELKGELGFKYHLMALASTTSSGIELRWLIETLIKIREEEEYVSGPTFGGADGSVAVALMRENDRGYIPATPVSCKQGRNSKILPSEQDQEQIGKQMV